jgi:hypothetical protein
VAILVRLAVPEAAGKPDPAAVRAVLPHGEVTIAAASAPADAGDGHRHRHRHHHHNNGFFSFQFGSPG